VEGNALSESNVPSNVAFGIIPRRRRRRSEKKLAARRRSDEEGYQAKSHTVFSRWWDPKNFTPDNPWPNCQ
jgi:hypothetical protein